MKGTPFPACDVSVALCGANPTCGLLIGHQGMARHSRSVYQVMLSPYGPSPYDFGSPRVLSNPCFSDGIPRSDLGAGQV